MSTIDIQNAALMYCLEQYRKQVDALQPAPSIPKAPKAPKLSTSHRKVKAPKADVKPFVPTFAYTVGSVSAEGFMKLLRSAGMRPNSNGVNVIHPAHVKQDEVEAINAYTGYDYRQNHGTQLDAARRKATLAMRNNLGIRSAKSTAEGWVKGTPDIVQRDIQNLLARERGAAENICNLQLQLAEVLSKLSDPYLSNSSQDDLQAQRNLVQGLIQVENERLGNIRADLSKLESL